MQSENRTYNQITALAELNQKITELKINLETYADNMKQDIISVLALESNEFLEKKLNVVVAYFENLAELLPKSAIASKDFYVFTKDFSFFIELLEDKQVLQNPFSNNDRKYLSKIKINIIEISALYKKCIPVVKIDIKPNEIVQSKLSTNNNSNQSIHGISTTGIFRNLDVSTENANSIILKQNESKQEDDPMSIDEDTEDTEDSEGSGNEQVPDENAMDCDDFNSAYYGNSDSKNFT